MCVHINNILRKSLDGAFVNKNHRVNAHHPTISCENCKNFIAQFSTPFLCFELFFLHTNLKMHIIPLSHIFTLTIFIIIEFKFSIFYII